MERKSHEVIAALTYLEKLAFLPDENAVVSRNEQPVILAVESETVDVVVRLVRDAWNWG